MHYQYIAMSLPSSLSAVIEVAQHLLLLLPSRPPLHGFALARRWCLVLFASCFSFAFSSFAAYAVGVVQTAAVIEAAREASVSVFVAAREASVSENAVVAAAAAAAAAAADAADAAAVTPLLLGGRCSGIKTS